MAHQAERAMIGMVEKAVEYDKNGIDIRFLNSQKECVVTVSPHSHCETLNVVA